MAKKKPTKTDNNAHTKKWILACRDEAEEARRNRIDQNELNWDMYHLRQDYSYKREGQSKEVLSKQAMAVEQISNFFQQSLVDVYEWWNVEAVNKRTEDAMLIKPSDVYLLGDSQLVKADIYSHIGLGVKSGLLGALTISKVHGEMVSKPTFTVERKGKGKKATKRLIKKENKVWQLRLDLVAQHNFYPDPSGDGLYEIEDMYVDFYKVKAQSEGDDAIYDSKMVDELSRNLHTKNADDQRRDRIMNNQNVDPGNAHRSLVKLTEYWGNILDDQGNLIHENIVATIANDTFVIRAPEPNPFWHNKSPYTIGSLIEVPGAVWPKALMDAPTLNNMALNELYNLAVDGAMAAAHDIKQYRPGYLEDVDQVGEGIIPGTSVAINDSAPPGAKAIETLTTGNVPPEVMSMINVMQQEFNASALTNDLRSGIIPEKSVKATEVVEASNTITSIFNGMSKNIETKWIQRILEKAWMNTAQNYDKLDSDEVNEILGDEKGTKLLQLDPEDVFAETINGVKFKVFGITQILKRGQDFKKWTTLLQVIGATPTFQEAFIKKYSLEDLLGEIMTSLDIREHKIRLPEAELQLNEEQQGAEDEGATIPGGEPDGQSQVASASSLSDILGEGGVPAAQFPGSPATEGQ